MVRAFILKLYLLFVATMNKLIANVRAIAQGDKKKRKR